MDPLQEYGSRLAASRQAAQRHDVWHRRLGNLRLLFPVVGVLIGVLLCRSHVAIGFVFLIILAMVFASGFWHDRVLKAKELALRAAQFYQSGLDRLSGHWAGKGAAGTEFLDPHHPYAIDLDLFGAGSVFELLNAAQTQTGRATLAQWMQNRAAPEEIRARQLAIDELRPKLQLREELAVQAKDVREQIRTEGLMAWASEPQLTVAVPVRVVAFILPLITLSLFYFGATHGRFDWFLPALVAQGVFALIYHTRVRAILHRLESPARDLVWLSGLLARLEAEPFRTQRLQQLQANWKREEFSASHVIRRLVPLLDWLDSRNNQLFAPICVFLMWGTQFAFAIEAWRAKYGSWIKPWLSALAEIEALSSVAGYAFEHPADPFPELVPESEAPLLAGEGLGHPLIAEARCIRNDVLMDSQCRLLVISGSNMSGKTTWLRTLGVNLVLASMGAPVRARKLRVSPLQIGASIRTMDSLQEGISRFYAEIRRLRQIVELTEHQPPVLFLLDELLGGTNSHDRSVGAASVMRSLVQRGAIGLVTTHDLALTRIVHELRPHGANFHFEDQLENGRLSFDYRLRTGIVEKSNALELMRSVGLEVS